jgi:hypothetical protein
MAGRRRPRDAWALLALLLVFSPAAARGQFRPPVPAPTPQEPTPTPAGQKVPPAEQDAENPTDIVTAPRAGGWEPLIVIEGVYEQNVGFTAPPGPDDYFGSIQGSLTRRKGTARTDMRLTLDGAGYAYGEQTSRNRADGGVGLRISSQLTPRVQGRLQGRFGYGHSDTEGALIDNALLLPLVRTITSSAGGELSWRLGERTTWALEAGWQRIDFDSGVLLDTQTWTAITGLSRRISEGEALSLRATLTRIVDDVSTRHEPKATVGLSSRLSRNVFLDLSAGAGRTQTLSGTELQPQQWSAQAAASLTVYVRNGQLSLSYEHGLRPTTGLGVTEITDLVGVNAVLPIGRKLELLARGSFAIRGATGNEGARRSREADAFTGAALRLARRLHLVAGYRFRYRSDPFQEPGTRNNRGSLSLAWGPEYLGAAR